MDNNQLEKAYSPAQAKKIILAIIANGKVTPTTHAKQEMAADRLTIVDCINILRGGIVKPAEWENGAWRYRVQTTKICVVIEFESETEIILVTAWRET